MGDAARFVERESGQASPQRASNPGKHFVGRDKLGDAALDFCDALAKLRVPCSIDFRIKLALERSKQFLGEAGSIFGSELARTL